MVAFLCVCVCCCNVSTFVDFLICSTHMSPIVGMFSKHHPSHIPTPRPPHTHTLLHQGSALQTTLEEAQHAQRAAEATNATLTNHVQQLQEALDATRTASAEQQVLNEEAIATRDVLIGSLRGQMEEAGEEAARVLEDVKVAGLV